MAVRSLERGLVEHLANPPVGPIITLKLPMFMEIIELLLCQFTRLTQL